ncbi:MAG: extracellular solute-binding protein [Oscillospiraceae bacterium]|nr:extracellular solute-binding protein [Oscillospiraceae bacterium]
MKDIKKILAGAMALTITAGLSACASEGGDSGAAETTTAEVTTTAAITTDINTETLAAEEADALAPALAQLQDVELANKEIKWLAHYDINPGTNGASKKVELELFERKYGGSIKWYQTTYENRYNDLSTYVLGGEGIDFYASDTGNLPKGIISGMFQSVDDYIDINSDIWQNTAEAMKAYNFGGKHFMFVTNTRANYYVYYNKETIEANGLDDPWDLYKAGNWNWDTFKGMLEEFVDEENDQWGLDNWFNELALLYSSGVSTIQAVDGQLKCNLNDATMEKAMNFQYDLYNSGLVLPAEQFNWAIQPQMMGEGRQLFWIGGYWEAEGDPSVWTHQIAPENLGFVPTPSPAGSDPYQAATLEGYVLCKGAQNPEGVARFAECTIVAVNDPDSIAISERKIMDDSKWPQELLDRFNEINDLAKKYPVVDLASGCSTDIASYTTDGGGNVGVRAAFHGTDWATMRESIADTIDMLVEEVNTELQAKVAEE